MADTNTDLLKFLKPEPGGSTNNWGNKLNDNLDWLDNVFKDMGAVNTTTGSSDAYEYDPIHDPEPNVALRTGLFIRTHINVDNTTTSPTLSYAGLAAKQIRKQEDGNFIALEAGDLTQGFIAEFLYSSTAIAGGCWVLLNRAFKLDPTIILPNMNQLCAHRNLIFGRVTQLASNTTSEVRADSVTLRSTTAGVTKVFGPIQKTLDISHTGNVGELYGAGLALTANTWYSVYLIGKADGTVDVIGSATDGGPGPTGGVWTSFPAMPSGYTFYGFVGCVRSDASLHNVGFTQAGNMVSIIDTAPINVNATSGVDYFPVNLSAYVPPEAIAVRLSVKFLRTTTKPVVPATVPPTTVTAPFTEYVEASVAPNPLFYYGDAMLGGVGGFRSEVTVMLKTANTVYARTPDYVATSSTAAMTFQVFVNGYWL